MTSFLNSGSEVFLGVLERKVVGRLKLTWCSIEDMAWRRLGEMLLDWSSDRSESLVRKR